MTLSNLMIIFAFGLGAVLGSFYNVVIYRIPLKKSIVFPASHCPLCNSDIKWYDNIPMLSYLLLRGKCRNCSETISWQYPMVELLSAVAAAYCLYRWELTMEAFFCYLFLTVLLIVSAIDLKHQIIPDIISVPGMFIFLLLSFLRPEITFLESLLGMVIGGAVILGVIMAYYLVTKKEGMGGGDIKLLALIGAFLGYKSLLFVIFVSSVVGSVIGIIYMIAVKGDRKLAIPFGPFLSLGGVIYLWRGPELIQFYINWTMY